MYILNRGFGGATLEDLTYYVKDIVYPYRPAMLNEDGSVREDIFVEDKVHMNKKGYDILVLC